MFAKKIIAGLTMASTLALTTAMPAKAGFLDTLEQIGGDAVGVVGDIAGGVANTAAGAVNTAVQVAEKAIEAGEEVAEAAMAPLKALEDTLVDGKSAKDAIEEMVDEIGEAVVTTANFSALVTHEVNAAIVGFVQEIAGDGVAKFANFVFLPKEVIAHLPAVIAEQIISVSKDVENAKNVVAVPLHALLAQVLTYYEGEGTPLPAQIKGHLAGFFEDAELDRVRYVVDDGGGNVAAIINALQTQFGANNHAVAVDHLIVFANEPGVGLKSVFWWAHEIQHTIQYSKWGVKGFAEKYLENPHAVEQEANDVALAAMKHLQSVLSS